MITKKVNRYYCEFCKKSGCSAGHISKHEKRCTANPDRECGMCELCDETQKPMAELVAVLPDGSWDDPLRKGGDGKWSDTKLVEAREGYQKLTDAGLNLLRDLTTCPACILSALRQRGVAEYSDFDFKEERDTMWSEIRDDDYNREHP